MKHIISFVILALAISSSTFAKESEKQVTLKAATVWAGVGGGTNTVRDPLDKFDSDGLNFLDAGGDIGLLGPFYATIGASWGLATGKMQYDYVDQSSPAKTHYTAPDLGYSSTYYETRAGLQLRIVDSPSFHLYVEGGGHLRVTDFTYDTKSNASLVSTGTNYQKEQKSVQSMGGYVEAGFDVLVQGWGIRVGGRALDGASEIVEALGSKRLFYKDGVAFAGVLHQF